MAERVLITGLGVVSPIGVGTAAYWEALLHAESRPRDHGAVPPSTMALRSTYSVVDRGAGGPRGPLGRDASDFGVRAARLAVEDAGLRQDLAPAGVVMGNAMGDDAFEQAWAGGPPVSGADLFSYEVGAAVAAALGLGGPNLGVGTACSAGLYSVSLAAEAIQSGEAEVMLAGGSEAVSRVAMACFNRLHAFDPEACRPFAAGRRGTVMGEGAAVMVLESEGHLRRRGGRAYARVEGAGWSCDGHHPTIPEPSGQRAVEAVQRALAEAGLSAGDIDCVLAHGTGTEQNDLMESVMIEQLFGARPVWVSGVKGKLGHGGGAAGAFQCLTGALVLDRGLLPPTGNVAEVDPRCHIHLARGAPVPGAFRHVLLNSYAFGGNNISLILGRVSDG